LSAFSRAGFAGGLVGCVRSPLRTTLRVKFPVPPNNWEYFAYFIREYAAGPVLQPKSSRLVVGRRAVKLRKIA
jgi:hypothetical protein